MITVPTYTDLLGKPFEYGGRGPDTFDCYGLSVELYRRAGLQLPDYASSDNNEAQGAGFADGAARFFRRVAMPEPMDIITFQVVPRFITHCGVYVGHGRFIHIMSKISVAVEELSGPIWQHRQRGIYRFRGVECNQ